MTQLLAHLFGDYILQSDWMAQNKTKHWYPALIHAMVYSCCFIPLLATRNSTWAMVAICGTHFLIDRFRLARYVVWAKNWLGPRKRWYFVCGKNVGDRAYWSNVDDWPKMNDRTVSQPIQPLSPDYACPTGYPSTTPIWLSTWLLIIADNTLHLAINYAALRWL